MRSSATTKTGCLADAHHILCRPLTPSCRDRIRYLVSRVKNASTEVTSTLPVQFLDVSSFSDLKHHIHPSKLQHRKHPRRREPNVEVDSHALQCHQYADPG